MSDLLVVTGPPGAGKSTIADLLVDHLVPSALVPGDDFFGFLRHGAVPPWLPEAHTQNETVIQAAAAAAGRLSQHCDVVYDGVVGPWFLETFREAAGVVRLRYAVLLPPLDTCLNRVRDRSGHEFQDLAAAEHMWCAFDSAPMDPRYRLDRELDPGAVAATIESRAAEGGLDYPPR